MSPLGNPRLLGRIDECERLDGLLRDVLAGRSRAIVLRGEAGVGKTALLEYLTSQLDGWRVARCMGVEWEMELAFSGLHQLCGHMLDQLDELPAPQRDALAGVFGLHTSASPDRFLAGLATLSLLAEVAEAQPLMCIVDDAHWLDQASAQILGFVARRLDAERIAIVCAARTGLAEDLLAGAPELTVGGLDEGDARALLLRNLHGPLDSAVADQIVTESHGNPLALLELPRTWSHGLAGGFGLPRGRPVAGKVEQSYADRLSSLPPPTRLLVLAAAAEPVGDPALLQRAAESLNVDMESADPAVDAGLVTIGRRVEFSHPLVRSAAYSRASAEDRQNVHDALAEATDPQTDPDRRAWHRARATTAPNEQVAAELERSANRARSRGGVAAAAAFLQRSAELTNDPRVRAERTFAAAQSSLEAGEFGSALAMLGTIEEEALDTFQRARTHLLRARIAAAASFGSAPGELLKAAREIEPLDIDLARETYLDAWGAALAAGELAGVGMLRDISQAALSAPPAAHAAYPSELLLDGLARLVTEGPAAAAPVLRQAVAAFHDDPKVLQWGAVAATGCAALWDMEGFEKLITRQLELARDAGALALLATAAQGAGIVASWSGEFAKAASLTAEADAVAGATGINISPYGGMLLAAYRGGEREASAIVERTIELATANGEGLGVQYAHWTAAILHNGLGRYERAREAAERASNAAPELFICDWALVELVEAAAAVGDRVVAAEGAERFAAKVGASGSEWAAGMAARLQALARDDDGAEPLYLEAVARLGRTLLRPEIARTHLLYGEWLRRRRRTLDARTQLGTAHDMLSSLGMEAFAERARGELIATGQKVRRQSPDTRDELTAQEAQIARLARDGLSNPEIGAQLYISARTVEWHLHKVFTKLGVGSRRQLRAALPDDVRSASVLVGR